MNFERLSLTEPLLQSLEAANYRRATAIQEKAIPQVLKGRDLVGCAQTGTGKTAAFALPMLQRLMTSTPAPTGASRRRQRTDRRAIRALIVVPTRELAAQIGASLAVYGSRTRLRHTVIFGGVRQGPQVHALQTGVDILVATPGRLLDLIGQGYVDLAAVEVLVLDEADQMLDMGFIHDLRKIVAHTPSRRQTLMFSATMPAEIRELATKWLRRPFEVQVAPVASTPEQVSQTVYFVERHNKAATLTRFLRDARRSKTLVFSRTKRGADKIARLLQRDGIRAVSIHGDKSQAKRQSVMREFNSPRPPVLIATDLAARGLDFSDISHVINYDLPEVPETYVHRIGRTARAGATGQAVSFCGRDERRFLRQIEKLTGKAVPVEQPPAIGRQTRLGAADNAATQPDESQPVGAGKTDGEKNAPRQRKRTQRKRHSQRKPKSSRSSSGSANGSKSSEKGSSGRPRRAKPKRSQNQS